MNTELREFPYPHDPSGGSEKHTIEIPLESGVQLLQTTTLTATDQYGADLTGDDRLVLLNIEIGFLKGNTWGVNFWPRFGKRCSEAYLRVVPYYSDGLSGIPGEDITVVLRIADT